MSKDNNGPAFGELQQVGDVAMRDGGLSIRDYFAAKALTGIFATCEREPGGATSSLSASALAAASYEMADAMLLERAK